MLVDQRGQAEVEQLCGVMDLLPVGVVVLEGESPATAIVARVNAAWAEITGVQPRVGLPLEVSAYHLYSLSRYEPLAESERPLALVLGQGTAVRQRQFHLRRPDGSWRKVLVSALPTRRDGCTCGAVLLLQDVSPPKLLPSDEQVQRDLLERMLADVPAAVVILEGDEHRCVFANRAAYAIAMDGQELVGQTMAELWPEAGHLILPILDHVYRSTEPYYATDLALPIDRGGRHEIAYFTSACIPVCDGAAATRRMLVLAVETSEEVLARRSLEEVATSLAAEQTYLRAVLEQMPVAVGIMEVPSGRLMLSNEEAKRLLGECPFAEGGELKAQPFHADGRPYVREERPLARAIATGEVVHGEEVHYRWEDGSQRIMSVNAAPIRDPRGAIVAGVVTLKDVTEEKRIEELLRQHEGYYHGFFDNLQEAVVVNEVLYGENGEVVDLIIRDLNTQALERMGLPAEAVLGKRVSEVFGRDTVASYWATCSEVMASGAGRRISQCFCWNNQYYIVSAFPIGVRLYAVVAAEITDRVQAEQARVESEQRERAKAAELQAVLDAVPAAVLITRDPQARTIEGNRVANELLRLPQGSPVFSREEYKPDHFRTVQKGVELVPEDRPVRRAVREGKAVRDCEYDLIFDDGVVHHLLANAELLRDERGAVRGAVGAYVEITQRKRAEERAASLQSMTAALGRALTVDDVADAALRQTNAVLGSRVGLVALPASDGREIEVRFEDGLDEALARPWLHIPLDAPVPIAEVMRTGEERIFENRAAWEGHYPLLAGNPPELGAIALLPLKANGRALGVLGLSFVGPRQFTAEDLKFMRVFAELAAQALERVHLYEAEQRARAAAQEASAAKDEFVALVSHELRNPLSALQAGAYILRQTTVQQGRAGRALEIIERNVRLQTRLVDDLLDLSRLSRGSLQLQRVPVALDRAVQAAVQAYDGEAREAGLELTCQVSPDLWVQGDFDRLQQVVMNLLSNAVKFTPRGGSITVRGEQVGNGVGAARIVVEDTGIGITPKLLEQLFQLFQQGEIGARRKAGLGIGLALVKGIVEKHGGRVWAQSAGPGQGSRFTVELPLVSGPRVNAPPKQAREEAREIHLLLVEDNADTRTLLADSLTLAGYDVQTAASGEEALELLEEMRPDVMLCDIGLPGINGYELLRQARQHFGLEQVPAFAVTGYGQEEDVRRGQRAGFAGHLTKPVDVQALDRLIREWVPGASAR